jgi:REP element-mobilizing transposase RayT
LFVDDKGKYQFWQNTNAPKKIENPKFYRQKLNYIHQNPLRKGYVANEEYWIWSSANPASPLSFKLFEA